MAFFKCALHINKLFAHVIPAANVSFPREAGPSCLKIQGTDYFRAPLPSSRQAFAWIEGPLSINPGNHSAWMVRAARSVNVAGCVSALCEQLQPATQIEKLRYQSIFRRLGIEEAEQEVEIYDQDRTAAIQILLQRPASWL